MCDLSYTTVGLSPNLAFGYVLSPSHLDWSPNVTLNLGNNVNTGSNFPREMDTYFPAYRGEVKAL